ncbi:MAG: hypothetical protein QW478_15625 [Candidatus Micrarchaeaceae archaeon]
MRMKKIASRQYRNYKWIKDGSFYKVFWIGELEGKKINYIVVNENIDKASNNRGKIKYYFSHKLEEENKMILKFIGRFSYITYTYNKLDKGLIINIKEWFAENFVYTTLKGLVFYHKKLFGIKGNNIEWVSIHEMDIKDGIRINKVNLYNRNGEMISVYLFKGRNTLYLDDIMKNKEIAEESKRKFLGMIEKQYNIVKKKVGRGKYTAGDLEKLGGLKVRAVSTVIFADLLRKRSWKNTRLRIPKGSEIIIKEKGYDLAGSIVWKAILLVPRYPYIRQTFLVGKEYTGTWWLHTVPPEYCKKSLAECERWILNLRDGDVVVSEA